MSQKKLIVFQSQVAAAVQRPFRREAAIRTGSPEAAPTEKHRAATSKGESRGRLWPSSLEVSSGLEVLREAPGLAQLFGSVFPQI